MENNFFSIIFTGLLTGSSLLSGTIVAKTTIHTKEKTILMQCSENQQQNDEYKSYRAEQEKMINENDKKIDELKAKRSNVKKEDEERYNEKINELEAKNNDLRKRIMKNYKNEGKDKWDSFKREYNHDMDDLGKSIKDMFKDNEM